MGLVPHQLWGVNATLPEHCRRVQRVEQQAASNSSEQRNTLFQKGEQ
jgi:hypothetical protein